MAKNTKKINRRKQANKHEYKFNLNAFATVMVVISFIMLVSIISDRMGIVGTYISTSLNSLFGILSIVFPILLAISFTKILIRNRVKISLKKEILIYIMFVLSLVLFSTKDILSTLNLTLDKALSNFNDNGGYVGAFLAFYLEKFIGRVGFTLLYILFYFYFCMEMLDESYKHFYYSLKHYLKRLTNFTIRSIKNISLKIKENKKNYKKDDIDDEEEFNEEINYTNRPSKVNKKKILSSSNYYDHLTEKENIESPKIINYSSKQMRLSDVDEQLKKSFDNYNYPSTQLLEDRSTQSKHDATQVTENAKIIETTLDSFSIASKVMQINVGPTITSYEVKPARGVKVSKIVNLADDLALALATSDIRIEAPIPGKPYVGIEVPNKHTDVVSFKELILSDEFTKSSDKLPFVLGKTISGNPVVSDIAKMPHLLVAGATGSGKSVCINTIIMSLIFKFSPEDVKMLLIDPKMVELSVYNGIPHLIMPVISDPKKAGSALFWAVSEMENRYKIFGKNKVRDITGYNNKQQYDDSLEKLPYIVVIIDELSDLMMVSANEVEDYICRLAQMSRACGIHLIIATQRPTVDVITGTIKANIPSRISFAVSSQIDSRTILDNSGAEKLLGKGDMLFLPYNLMKPKRIQGAFVSEDEVVKVVEAIKEENKPEYDTKVIEKVETELNNKNISEDDEDELIKEAIEIIVNEQSASVSLIQRKLKVGYARAGRIIDQLESRGIVGGFEGSKPRKVLVDRNYLNRGEKDEHC